VTSSDVKFGTRTDPGETLVAVLCGANTDPSDLSH
jgi:hypothetical protein